jgi:DHA3 family macrolide efflux protein-like MFS transporter
VLMLIYTTAASFHFAAFDTSYAVLVSDEQLPRANGMMQTIHALADVIAPAIAALLIGLPALARQGAAPPMLGWLQEGAALAFGVDAITFMVAAIGLLLVRIPAPLASHQASARERHTLWADVRVGADFIWQRRPMLWLLGTFTIANLCFSPLMIFVPLVVKFGQAGDWSARGMTFESALALMTGAIGLGGVAGGIAISVWGGLRRRRVLGVVAPMIFAGLMQLIFGLSPRYDLAVAAAFLIALTGPAMNAHSQAIWQAQTPRELQGRVFAVRRLIGQCTAPLGTLMAGVIGGLFNPGHALAALGLLLALFCTAQLFNPGLRQVDDRHWNEGLVTGQTSSVSNT